MIRPRTSVLNMKAYAPPLEGRRGKARLDFNENTAGPPFEFTGLSPEEIGAYPEYDEALTALASHLNIDADRILMTNGTGEAIFTIAFTFIEPGTDAAVTSSPTFALIPHALELVGARLTEAPATENYAFDLAAIERAMAGGAKVVILASPDNPTGATISNAVVRDWCRRYPETLFVIDEAYAEYGNASVLELIGETPNLLVLRTFSKAWGMAGLRLGLVVGDPDLIEYLKRVRAPYSVNAAAVAAMRMALSKASAVRAEALETLKRKDRLVADVHARGWATHAAAGNFFLIKAGGDASPLCSFCREQNILLRDQSSKPGMAGIVRVTVGTESENASFIECLNRFREQHALIFDLDDTLVDTSKSFDATIATLVERYSGTAIARDELLCLRAEGGFNDDWDATVEVLRRRGITIPPEVIAREGTKSYLTIARDNESLTVDTALLERLAKRFRLLIVTGRRRAEYEPIWQARLDPFFEAVYCRDDFDGLDPKPAPDMLIDVRTRHGIASGYYVGNAVDDMASARTAGFFTIGITTTLDGDSLRAAGASEIITSIGDLERMFML